MKISILVIAAFSTTLVLSSCNKDFEKEVDTLFSELASERDFVQLEDPNYERVESETLVQNSENDPYEEGVIEYRENGTTVARVDFGALDPDHAKCWRIARDDVGQLRGEDYEVELKKDASDKEYIYDKVIIEPLVTVKGCDYIVAGIIKFYKKGTWVATFDYGDGNCDALIDKTTKDGFSTFSMDDYPEWN